MRFRQSLRRLENILLASVNSVSFPENGVTVCVMGVTVHLSSLAACALIFMSGMCCFDVFYHVLPQSCQMGSKRIVNVSTLRCLATATHKIFWCNRTISTVNVCLLIFSMS